MAKKRKGQCVYCGSEKSKLTEDHIPPKALCAKPYPTDIVKVPSCRSCNVGASLDDEYFKTIMVLKDGAGSHPEAVGIRDSVFRGFQMHQKLGFARSIVHGIRLVDVRTMAGLYLRPQAAFDVNLGRVDRVVARITRGLFWYHKRDRLPDQFDVAVCSEEGLSGLDNRNVQAIREEVIIPVLNNPEHAVGRGVMHYWHAFATDHAHVSAWLYEFYGDVRFIALVVPRHGL